MNLAFGRCRDINGPLMEAALALYRSSFPAHELRLPPDQRDVMSDPLYHFDVCLLDGALAGLILYWDFGAYIYVEHFCVEPSLRGHGLGTLILAELARQNKTIILEIDPLVDDASVRRKGFYERCGYVANAFAHVHPPYQAANRGHELIVMSYPHAISQSEFDSFTLDLGEKVMKYSEGKRNA